jgi:hypothetical protein
MHGVPRGFDKCPRSRQAPLHILTASAHGLADLYQQLAFLAAHVMDMVVRFCRGLLPMAPRTYGPMFSIA